MSSNGMGYTQLPLSPGLRQGFRRDEIIVENDRWQQDTAAPVSADPRRASYRDFGKSSQDRYWPTYTNSNMQSDMSPGSDRHSGKQVASSHHDKLTHPESNRVETSVDLDFSKLPRGSKHKTLELPQVSESDKRMPHIRIPSRALYDETSLVKKLNIILKKYEPVYVQVDSSGYYLGFDNNPSGLANLNRCYEANQAERLLNGYKLEMTRFPFGQPPGAGKPRSGGVDAQSTNSATSQKVKSVNDASAAIMDTPPRDRFGIDAGNMLLNSGVQAPLEGTMMSPPVLGTRTSALQNNDDNSSVRSWRTLSERSSSSSQGKSLKCQICKKASPLDATSLVACTNCQRRFHKGCHKPMILGPIDVWRCFLCEKKENSIKTSASVRDEQEIEHDRRENPSKRPKLEPSSYNKTSPLRLQLSQNAPVQLKPANQSINVSHNHSQIAPAVNHELVSIPQKNESFTTDMTSSSLIEGSNSALEPRTLAPVLPSMQHNSPSTPGSHKRRLMPDISYVPLIAMALLEAPQYRLTAAAIHEWIAANVPGYTLKTGKWQSAVSAILSQKSKKEDPKAVFEKQLAGPNDKSKHCWWALRKGCEGRFGRWDPNLTAASPSVPVLSDTSLAGTEGPESYHERTAQPTTVNGRTGVDEKTTSQKSINSSSGQADGSYPGRRSTSESLRRITIEMRDMHSTTPCTPTDNPATMANGPSNHESEQDFREIQDSADPALPDLVQTNSSEIVEIQTLEKDPSAASKIKEGPSISAVAVEHSNAECAQDHRQTASPTAEGYNQDLPDIEAGEMRLEVTEIPYDNSVQVLDATSRRDSAAGKFPDRDQRATNLVREHIDQRVTSSSLYDSHPQYDKDAPGHDLGVKLREIRSRPTRKQVFGKPTVSRLAGRSPTDYSRMMEVACQPDLLSMPYTVSDETLGSMSTEPDSDHYIDRFESIGELLGLPSLVVPMMHENQLAFRDGTQVTNGRLRRPKVIYKIGHLAKN